VPGLLQWRRVANVALQLALLALLIAAFFVRTPQVAGLSMSPHIAPGEYVLVNTFAYRFSQPRRGEIVAFHGDSPRQDDARVLIKRVVGLPGDRVRVDRGTVFLNGVALREPYVRYPDERSFPETSVPSNCVYVLGDNRAESEDSRFFGPVSDDRLVGRALLGIWPPPQVGAL
jgi:signal peptidase I